MFGVSGRSQHYLVISMKNYLKIEVIRRYIRLSFVLVAYLIGSTVVGKADAINVGVRADTPPFSSRLGEKENSTYSGFLIELCTKFLGALNEPYKLVEVRAGNRFDGLRDGSVDFLCEPTSLTSDRLDEFAFTFPLFVTGLSYARFQEVDITRKSKVIGLVANTTAERGMTILADGNVFGELVDNIFDQHGSIIEQSTSLFPSHVDGITALCNGDVMYYIADKDILYGLVERVDNCNIYLARETFTREIYALTFLSPLSVDFKKLPEQQKSKITKLFWRIQKEIFSFYQTSEIDIIFQKYFGNKVMSDELRKFYEIGNTKHAQ